MQSLRARGVFWSLNTREPRSVKLVVRKCTAFQCGIIFSLHWFFSMPERLVFLAIPQCTCGWLREAILSIIIQCVSGMRAGKKSSELSIK